MKFMILNRKIINFVETLTDGKVTQAGSESGTVVFKMNTLISLKEFTTAVKNEFPCVDFDYPADEKYIIVYWDWKALQK